MKAILSILLWPAKNLVGKKLWNWLFLFLMSQAPRIWGGKYGAKKHGRKSRDWLYRIWVTSNDNAKKTVNPFDDNGIEFTNGFFLYDIESTAMLQQLEQVMADITANELGHARERLAEVMNVLRMPN